MVVFVCVAGITILGGAFVGIVHMTGFTGYRGVRSRQGEARIGMVEGGILPFARVMTGGTSRAELSVMGIVFGMTGKTCGRRPFEHSIHVTGCALHFCMAAFQGEAGRGVIEMDILPSGGNVTFSAVRAELPAVRIFRGVTGIAI